MMRQRLKEDTSSKVMFVILMLLVILIAVQITYILTRSEPKKLLNYPEQIILNPHNHSAGEIPEIGLSQSVLSQGTKCNTSSEPISVKGELFWRPIAPGGKSILVAKGASIKEPGCFTTDYDQSIPRQVYNETCELITKGYKNVTWQLTGTEIPTDPYILPETWITEPFILVDDLNICR